MVWLFGWPTVGDHKDLAGRPAVGLEHAEYVCVGDDQARLEGEEPTALGLAAVGQLDLEVDSRRLDLVEGGFLERGGVGKGKGGSQQGDDQQADDATGDTQRGGAERSGVSHDSRALLIAEEKGQTMTTNRS